MLDYKLYPKEIISMIEKIENSMINKTLEDFVDDSNLFDATLMRLHFIGETIKSVPFSIKKNYKKIRWRKFARLRNIIGHKYSNVNKNIIWDVIKALSELKVQVKEILDNENKSVNVN
ncbi:MAG: HepT-like ribonuclease domain-containing protein [Nanoarchaeota archaeon]